MTFVFNCNSATMPLILTLEVMATDAEQVITALCTTSMPEMSMWRWSFHIVAVKAHKAILPNDSDAIR